MQVEVEKKGGKITKAYYAPGIVSAKNEMRKPKPGMALLAQRQYNGIDFNKSVMVGDTDSDILFGQNLGMKTVRIQTVEKIGVKADLTVNSLNELVKLLVK
jgi:HAD superfamily hydrolase (TIGR01662 family)